MVYFSTPLKFSSDALSAEKYNLVKHLLDSFPDYLKDNPNKTYGCPDCYDQGRIYIEIEENGEFQSWNIDTDVDGQPEEIRAYIEDMRDVLGQL